VNAERKDNVKLPLTNGNRIMRKRKTGIELKNDVMEYLLLFRWGSLSIIFYTKSVYDPFTFRDCNMQCAWRTEATQQFDEVVCWSFNNAVNRRDCLVSIEIRRTITKGEQERNWEGNVRTYFKVLYRNWRRGG
jgi:hypothetical protein